MLAQTSERNISLQPLRLMIDSIEQEQDPAANPGLCRLVSSTCGNEQVRLPAYTASGLLGGRANLT